MATNWYERALRVMPGGVSSPVRSFKQTGLPPVFVKEAHGCRVFTESGAVLTDYCLSWGVMLLGHDHPFVRKKLSDAVSRGTSFGMNYRGETELAEAVTALYPSLEKVRFVNSGTEAVMSAVRLARGVTGRDLILKFDGCYHGHSDGLLVFAGSGVGEIMKSSSAGIPDQVTATTLSIPYNDRTIFLEVMKKKGNRVAAVIVEPVAGNMGVIPPLPGFLETLRKETLRTGSLLIFDEVITGFRVSKNGAQGYYGIEPDLTTLGKIIGGGMPMALFGGRAELMDLLAPVGNVYQAGTLSGNPLAMEAGKAVLGFLRENPQIYDELEEKGCYLEDRLGRLKRCRFQRVGSLFSVFHTANSVENYEQAQGQSSSSFRELYAKLLSNNILMPPSPLESAFLSLSHDRKDLDHLCTVFEEIFAE